MTSTDTPSRSSWQGLPDDLLRDWILASSGYAPLVGKALVIVDHASRLAFVPHMFSRALRLGAKTTELTGGDDLSTTAAMLSVPATENPGSLIEHFEGRFASAGRGAGQTARAVDVVEDAFAREEPHLGVLLRGVSIDFGIANALRIMQDQSRVAHPKSPLADGRLLACLIAQAWCGTKQLEVLRPSSETNAILADLPSLPELFDAEQHCLSFANSRTRPPHDFDWSMIAQCAIEAAKAVKAAQDHARKH